MKKITAALLCVMLVISTSVTAFGATKNDVKEKIDTAVAFSFDGNYSKTDMMFPPPKICISWRRAARISARLPRIILNPFRTRQPPER